MGLIVNGDVMPDLRVRHRDGGWTGQVKRTAVDLGLVEVEPDGGCGPRWFPEADFDPVDWDGGQLPARVPITDWDGAAPRRTWDQARVPVATTIERRYLNDPAFHQLVHVQRQLLRSASYADLRDAADLAIRIDTERRKRDGGGDDGRGRESGGDEAAEQESGRAAGTVSRP